MAILSCEPNPDLSGNHVRDSHETMFAILVILHFIYPLTTYSDLLCGNLLSSLVVYSGTFSKIISVFRWKLTL